ncbi:NEW3 domain-containing protein [Paenibacillus alvei]|uniref:NEW3 domain-containing protein n=1 Tax=Paenibacillus alvei TaxID=44250 RepID=A0ABT4GV57_PAEAL|nr:NEW3 domain-containing protein [Paenibacillus alvei]MCY9760582.1 NEW3 domain-containing protein [Paenibacillus alvei]MCY9770878.1 NEW3 domain-containing protein [Paenibacillus alvei]
MIKGKSASTFCSIVLSVVLGSSVLLSTQAETVSADRGIVDLWKSIKPLTTIASAMNTGAHPDDEHSATLAYLSLGRGINTSSVIAVRGEGGQNEIGSELGQGLGVIRTRELQEASKITNVTLGMLGEQLNDPIFDFGFSKSVEETLEKWGESVAYERLIRKIRELRPDVIIPAFLNENSTHGHHRTINVLTVRAFKDAANPDVYPEHLKQGLQPWQIKKLYLPANDKDYTVRAPIGEYNNIYGASYLQLGEESRFMHKSQGMGRVYDEGASQGDSYYKLDLSTVKTKEKEQDFFDGIAFTFADLAKEISVKSKDNQIAKDLQALQQDADRIVAAYPSFANVLKEVHGMKADVQTALADVKKSSLDAVTKEDLLHRLHVKEEQLNKASMEAASVVVKVKPDANELVAGQTTKVVVTAFNGGSTQLNSLKLSLNVPAGWTATPVGTTSAGKLGYNETASAVFEVKVPADAPLFKSYEASVFQGKVDYEAYKTATTLQGTPQNAVAVLPPYSMTLSPSATILNTLKPGEPIPVKVTVRNYTPGASKAAVSLNVPAGWTSEPAAEELSFAAKGETKSVAYSVKAASNVRPGKFTVTAIAKNGNVQSMQGTQVIQYPHIGKTYLVQPAELQIQAFDLKTPEKWKVGYVSSGFDNIDQYLRQVGVNVVNLDAKDIESGDLSPYNAIVLGIRAYAFRPELIPSNQRLLNYVKNGGNLVVQYHKPEDKWSPDLAPYPIKIGSPLIQWRVTDENSKVITLAPEHPMFSAPNKISDQDWNNWSQDRSAYNPSEWGKEYTELISNGDPGEKEFTGTFLTANYGKGVYTYSSLVWYREIPALVPGSIRMFVNMVSQHQ